MSANAAPMTREIPTRARFLLAAGDLDNNGARAAFAERILRAPIVPGTAAALVKPAVRRSHSDDPVWPVRDSANVQIRAEPEIQRPAEHDHQNAIGSSRKQPQAGRGSSDPRVLGGCTNRPRTTRPSTI